MGGPRIYIPSGQLAMNFNVVRDVASAVYPGEDFKLVVEPDDILTRRAPDDDKIATAEEKYAYRKEYLKWQNAINTTNTLLQRMKNDLLSTRDTLARQRN